MEDIIVSEEVADERDPTELALMSLPPKQRRFIPMFLSGQYNKSQIAELLNVQPDTIRRWLAKKEVQDIINEEQTYVTESARAELKTLNEAALHTMRGLLKSPIDGIKYQAAKDILDRNGLKGINEIKIDKTVTTIEQRITSLIDDTMGDIVDVEFKGE